MAVVHITFEEFADRIEEMLDWVDKGDKVFIRHEGKLYTITLVSDEELEGLTESERALLDK